MTPASHPCIFLQAGQDRRIAAGHPWAFSNEIRMDRETVAVPAGALVTLHRVDGKALGIGTFNPHALVAFRLLDRDPQAVIDAAWVGLRLRRALRLRERLFGEPFYRLVHAEADDLPGLVVDRFADVLAVQVNTAGMEALSGAVLEALDDTLRPAAIVLRNDTRARGMEGLAREVRVAKGTTPGLVEVRERGLVFPADVMSGQKTGWFYDQRDNRLFVSRLAVEGSMLDVFCHSGAFAVRAAAAGALAALAIDSSETALALARRAAEMNGVADRVAVRRGDAFGELEALFAARERFHVVAADPPAFAKSRKELKTALKGYRKLAHLSARLVKPGGFLFLATCSHVVASDAFLDEVRRGLDRAGRSGRFIRAAGAGPDHPVHPWLPETAYLKTLVAELD